MSARGADGDKRGQRQFHATAVTANLGENCGCDIETLFLPSVALRYSASEVFNITALDVYFTYLLLTAAPSTKL